MKVRICPLCDQPMKKAHRCDNCNSFIWKPEYLDIHYNTDTVKGEDCSYDSKPHDYDRHEDGSVTMMPSDDKPVRRRRNAGRTKPDTYSPTDQPNRERSERRASGKGKAAVILTLVFAVISLIGEIFSNLEDRISFDFFGTGSEEIVSETGYTYDEDDGYSVSGDGERIEYTDEEVMSGGRECTGMQHMEATIDEFISAAESELSELGVDISYYSDASNNYSYDYGSDSYTYFVQERMYDMDTEIGYYYVISWDTFSKRLHEVSYNVHSSENAEEFYVSTMQALTGSGEKFRSEFREQRGAAEENEYVFFDTDGYEVYINYYEGDPDSYYISIVKAM